MNKELLKIIKRKTKRGYPEGELRNELQQQGLSETEINELFDSITGSSESDGTDTLPQENQNFLLIASGLGITGLALLSFNNGSLIGWLFILPAILFLAYYALKKISGSFERKE